MVAADLGLTVKQDFFYVTWNFDDDWVLKNVGHYWVILYHSPRHVEEWRTFSVTIMAISYIFPLPKICLFKGQFGMENILDPFPKSQTRMAKFKWVALCVYIPNDCLPCNMFLLRRNNLKVYHKLFMFLLFSVYLQPPSLGTATSGFLLKMPAQKQTSS